MNQKVVKTQVFGDMTVIWAEENNRVEMKLIPAGMEKSIVPHRRDTNNTVACKVLHKIWDLEFFGREVESAIQYKLAGDAYGLENSAGNSMRDSESVARLNQYAFSELPNGVRLTVRDDRGIEAYQDVCWQPGNRFITVSTTLTNKSETEIDVEYLAAFSLGGLSPFQSDDAPDTYKIAQWLCSWSAEGRLVERYAEEFGLERSWAGFAPRILRFGENSSKPSKAYFPQIGFTDTKAGVTWGAVLDVFGSWELEVNRKRDTINISGGYPDLEFGQWKKTLAPGESLTSPAAAVTCVAGDVQDMQNRIVGFSEGEVREQEKDLPLLFNDWCTTWGKPYPCNLLPIADKLKRFPIRYFIMDDGWFIKEGAGIGDWIIDADKYPQGFKHFCDELRQKGYIPGIWFEFENAVDNSRVLAEHPDWFLHLNGKILKNGVRSFLDFRKDEVVEYVAEKVIKFLKENNIGYTKIDYNAATGFGCDGAESPAEGLRQHILGVEKFFRRLLAEMPDLVLEVCASGGNRLTPAWLRLGSLVSSSDAHEGVEIPIIAANTAGLLPMRKNQLWATLHPEDDDNRFYYSLAAGFMGRLCFSGDIAPLSEHQLDIVDKACQLYRKAVPVIGVGDNRLVRKTGLGWLDPKGHQAWMRQNDQMALLVVHTFGNTPGKIKVKVPRSWKISGELLPPGVKISRFCNTLTIKKLQDFQGLVLLFDK